MLLTLIPARKLRAVRYKDVEIWITYSLVSRSMLSVVELTNLQCFKQCTNSFFKICLALNFDCISLVFISIDGAEKAWDKAKNNCLITNEIKVQMAVISVCMANHHGKASFATCLTAFDSFLHTEFT